MSSLFSFNATSTTDIYTLSLHDALPILHQRLNNLPVECGGDTIAEGIAVKDVGNMAFAIIQKTVEEVLVVAEETIRSEEHTSELQSLRHLVCRLLLEKKKKVITSTHIIY